MERIRGYRKKPRWIYVLGWCYVLLPLVTLFQAFRAVGYSVSHLGAIASSEFFLMEVLYCWAAAVAILMVTRLSFVVYLGLSFYAIGLKVSHLWSHPFLEQPLDVFVVVFLLGVTALLLATPLRTPYLNPRVRWWRQAPRYEVQTFGAIRADDVKFPVRVLNLSVGGAFVTLQQSSLSATAGDPGEPRAGTTLLSDDELRRASKHLAAYPSDIGVRVRLAIRTIHEAQQLFPEGTLEAAAEVVWRSDEKSPYRHGLGCQFIGLTGAERRRLRQYVRLLERCGVKRKAR